MSGPGMSNPLDDMPPVETTPSPNVHLQFTRLQAESLERHLTAQATKRWAPVLKELRAALERNANGKRYPWQKGEP